MMRHSRQAGITLAESLIAAAVLAAAVSAISSAIVAGQTQMRYSVDAQLATRLAEERMERILSLPYHDPDGESLPGPELGEIEVSDFDNADDFDGCVEPAGMLVDTAGDDYPQAYGHFSRSVTAQYASAIVLGLADPIPGLNVTVTVQDHKGQRWTVSRFIPE